ncbi:MAG: retroviral-like aspartic protease family protein, partial [Tepidiformaceae bacterium]
MPRLGVLARIDFLVDTGAEQTVLHPRGAAMLNIDHRALARHVNLSGVGGSGSYAPEFAVLAFDDGGAFVYLTTTLFVAAPSSNNRHYPSLLGRDTLGHFRMTYD